MELTDQIPPDPGYDGLHLLVGTKLANVLRGTPRGDKVMGLAGHDWVFGGAGVAARAIDGHTLAGSERVPRGGSHAET